MPGFQLIWRCMFTNVTNQDAQKDLDSCVEGTWRRCNQDEALIVDEGGVDNILRITIRLFHVVPKGFIGHPNSETDAFV